MAVLAGASLFIAGAAHAQQRDIAATARPLTLAERQAAWSSNKDEYRRRVASDGQASADRWLDEQARATHGQARAAPTQSRPAPARRAGAKDCKKVRWVNRATPGFGGAPMTMRRVAICAD